MKRFFFLAVVLLGSLPMGISIAGCGLNQNNYCDASDQQRINQPTSIVLQPLNNSISLAYTQTRLLATPSAKNCLGNPVSVQKYTYASSNNNLLDVSPTGNMCAGSWNRNTGGGIPDYSLCSAPSQATIEGLLAQGNNTYANFSVNITAAAAGVTSNAVPVYSHPQVSSVVSYPSTSSTSCVPPSGITCSSNSQLTPTACISQIDASATGGLQFCSLVCAEALVKSGSGYTTQLTDITSAAGQIVYSALNNNVVTIGTTGLANPVNPGSTVITANVSGTTGSAGIFSTCAPANIQLSLPNSPTPTFITIPPGNTQALQINATDTNGNPVSLKSPTYTSSTPSTITINSLGVVAPIYGGNADVYAACLPPACNPSPLDYLGLYGNGQPLASNAVRINAPGTVSSIIYMTNFSNGPYFSALNTNSSVVTPVTMPYVPNSMVISQDGTKLYFGSDTELMSYTTSNLSLAGADLNVPGKVLAVSPDGTTLIISGYTKAQSGQPVGQPVLYIYSVSTGTFLSQGTVSPATRAQFSADGTTVYIVAGQQEYIATSNISWTIQPVVNGAVNGMDIAAFTPSVGAFFSGPNTQVVNYCTTQYVPATINHPGSATFFYPAASTGLPSDRLGISNDGIHLFTATSANSSSTPFTFTDACVSVSPYNNFAGGKCTAPVTPAGDNPIPVAPCPITVNTGDKTFSTSGILPAGASLTGVPVATSSSTLSGANSFFTAYTAFLTYTGVTSSSGGAVLPYHQCMTHRPHRRDSAR